MDYQSKDRFPYNIEAAQKLYIQYSEDIIFEYTGSNYPIGENHEGFTWEDIYNPVPHYIGDIEIGRHVWMRLSIGDKSEWTLPMRITDAFTNISSTEGVISDDGKTVSFVIKYTLDSGEIVYSEPITVSNGTDGIGITNTQILNDNLVITYSDNNIVNLGRVTGFDGTGIPTDSPNEYYLKNINNSPVWTNPTSILNSTLIATLPLEYTEPNFTHSNIDGYRHIPIGGNNNDSLLTDGNGNYSWLANIPWSALDDTAGTGDTLNIFSADKIMSLIGSGTGFGIKYSVDTIVEMNAIVGMSVDELCVVNTVINRPVYKYDGATWNSFFDLDATHIHDDRYYTEVELNTSGAGGQVHWDNIINEPAFYSYWTINADTGTNNITNLEALTFIGGSGVTTSLSGNNLTINATGTTYTAGLGLDLIGTVFSHENTSSLLDTSYSGGIVINNVTIDTYGHLQSIGTINLDTRYAQVLTVGAGLTGDNYNGSSPTTLEVDFSGTGSANTVARSDHSHDSFLAASGLPSTTIDFARVNDYYSETAITGDVMWGFSNIEIGKIRLIDVKTDGYDIMFYESGITIKGNITNRILNGMSPTHSNLISVQFITADLVWIKLLSNIFSVDDRTYDYSTAITNIIPETVTDYEAYRMVDILPVIRDNGSITVGIDYYIRSGVGTPLISNVSVSYFVGTTAPSSWTFIAAEGDGGVDSGTIQITVDEDEQLYIKIKVTAPITGTATDSIATITLIDGTVIAPSTGTSTASGSPLVWEEHKGVF